MTTPNTDQKLSITPQNNTTPDLKSLTDYYAHYYKVVFNKLNKRDQDELLINLGKPNLIIRGEPVKYENVKTFVKAVIILAEEAWDKAQAKKSGSSTQVVAAQPVTDK